MNKKLRLGIIGCGGIANHIASLSRVNRRVQLVACCDQGLEQAQPFAKKHHIPQAYADYKKMLADEKLDAVYLATPHFLHFEMIKQAIEHNLNIFTEKPITRTIKEGKEAVQLAKQAGIKLGVNYQYRYDAGCYRLAMAAHQGLLGKINYGRCNIPWSRGSDYFDKGLWRVNISSAGGGTLITQGSHILDILLWASGSPPRAALGWTAHRKFDKVEVEDLAMGMIELESGAVLQICSSMVAASEQAVTIELYGEKGTALYTNLPSPKVHFEGIKIESSKLPPLPIRGRNALARSLDGYVAWVLDDIPFLIPGEEALSALASVESIYRSAQTGNKETVDCRF